MSVINGFLLKKIWAAAVESIKQSKPLLDPCLIMTLLVKDEADILEQNLTFHKKMGVDGFIVTDNNSTDATLSILEKYKKKGWVKEIIEEKGRDYRQKVWVDRMVWMAKTKYNADWVINADADEFWYAPSGNLKTEIRQTKANVLKCKSVGVYPEEGKCWMDWQYTVTPISDIEKYDLSPYSVFAPQRGKVIHRTQGYIQIAMGNHKVMMFPRHMEYSHIYIYHYSVRERERFLKKMINGGKQLEQNPSKHGGRHWRYFYQLYKGGKLDEEYNRVIGLSYVNALKQDGYIHYDPILSFLFDKMK